MTERPQGSVWGPGPRQSGLMTAEQRLRDTEWGPGTIHAVVTRSVFVCAQIAMKRFMTRW